MLLRFLLLLPLHTPEAVAAAAALLKYAQPVKMLLQGDEVTIRAEAGHT